MADVNTETKETSTQTATPETNPQDKQEQTVDITKPLISETPDQPTDSTNGSATTPTMDELMAQLASLKAENASLHRANNKASSDAADWKKKYQSKLTVDEQRANQEQEREAYTKTLEKDLAVLKDTIALQGQGYSEEDAKAIAEFRYTGNFVEAAAIQNAYNEKIRKALEDDYKQKVTELMKPASGNGNGVDYDQQFASALEAGDRVAAVSAKLKQNNFKFGG